MRTPSILAHCLLGVNDRSSSHEVSTVSERDPRLPSPAVEIVPAKVFQNVDPSKYAGENAEVEGIGILKGKTSVVDVIRLTTSPERIKHDGLRSCESSMDLVNILKHETRDGQLKFRGKHVLELNCGYGLPGTFACLKGASIVHFQDMNAETLRCLTIPNVLSNIEKAREPQSHQPESPLTPPRKALTPKTHFYAGDYGKLHAVLSIVQNDGIKPTHRPTLSLSEDDLDSCSSQEGSVTGNESSSRRSRKLPGSRAWERATENVGLEGGYDIILVAEIPYSVNSLKKFYSLIKKCLRPPYGVIYLTAKKNYIGSNSGARQLKSLVEEEGLFGGHMLTENADREIWKFFCK